MIKGEYKNEFEGIFDKGKFIVLTQFNDEPVKKKTGGLSLRSGFNRDEMLYNGVRPSDAFMAPK